MQFTRVHARMKHKHKARHRKSTHSNQSSSHHLSVMQEHTHIPTSDQHHAHQGSKISNTCSSSQNAHNHIKTSDIPNVICLREGCATLGTSNRGLVVLVEAEANDGQDVGAEDEDEATVGGVDAVVVEVKLGVIVAVELGKGVGVVHHERKRRRQEGEGDGAGPGNEGRLDGEERREEEEDELDLDDPPLVLEDEGELVGGVVDVHTRTGEDTLQNAFIGGGGGGGFESVANSGVELVLEHAGASRDDDVGDQREEPH